MGIRREYRSEVLKVFRKFILSAGLLSFLASYCVITVGADEATDRDALIEKKLNCTAQNFSDKKNPRWADLCLTDVPTPQDDGREELISQELEAASHRLRDDQPSPTRHSFLNDNATGQDNDASSDEAVSEDEDVSPEDSSEEPSPEYRTYLQDHRPSQGKKFSVPGFHDSNSRDNLKKTEIALQSSLSKYEADEIWPFYYPYSVGHAPTKKGQFWGAYLSYTYRRPYKTPVHTWKDLKRETGGPGTFFTFARLELDAAKGKVTYDSYASGKLERIPAWRANVRLLGGYDFTSQNDSFMVTPYVGLGYRRAVDKTGGWVDFIPTGYRRYEVLFDYFYIPMGFETLKHINDNWDVGFKAEGSIILGGTVTLAQSDIPGIFDSTDLDTGLPIKIHIKDADSDLNGGFGCKSSFKIIRKFSRFNIFTEPFFELWHLNLSAKNVSEALSTEGQSYYSAYPDKSPYKSIFEPSNYTLEYGLRVGVQF